jgi:hypothetical protein
MGTLLPRNQLPSVSLSIAWPASSRAVTNSRVVHEAYLGSTLPCRPIPTFQRRLNEAAKAAFGPGAIEVIHAGVAAALVHVLIGGVYLHIAFARRTA